MYISKTRFTNWTRCPMYFAMELKHNPSAKEDIDAERERRIEMMGEIASEIGSAEGDDEESFDAEPSQELEALLPYYNQVEDEALNVARRYFHGTFVSDSRDVHNQKLFEYVHSGHVYRCYVDIYNENEDEINIIEVKATTCSKFAKMEFSDVEPRKRGGSKYPLFVKDGNFLRLNKADSAVTPAASANYAACRGKLLSRYSDEGKYPHDIAFQRFVISNVLRAAGDSRKVNYYLAVLNSDYFYDGARDGYGRRVYNCIDGQEVVVFIDMNDVSSEYQSLIRKEIVTLESWMASPHDLGRQVKVGPWCAWGKNTQCLFHGHCFESLRHVPAKNRSNSYIHFWQFKDPAGDIYDKYRLINEGMWKLDDVPFPWLSSENHIIQRDVYNTGVPHVDKDKMRYWLDSIEYPIYHLDFESFPCPLPRFSGENPYRQSVFEFSLHVERKPGVCDLVRDNVIFLNRECDDDERAALAEALVSCFVFNEDGTLRGTMLAQNTGFERGRLEELADACPLYRDRLLAIREKSADLIHLLRTHEEFYKANPAFKGREKTVNYYHKDLSGSYSIKKTLPVLVPSLTYSGMDVGNGVQAYIAYLNYDSDALTFGRLGTKEARREALSTYCRQDTWAMVEILRAVRAIV